MFDEQWPRLEGLFALSKARGLDVRPTLLRVLTDLFVESGQRSESEVARYAELASHLVEQVDEETRFVVAGKLAASPQAPRIVIDKLIASEPEAAGRIIAASPLLTLDDLWTLAADGGPMTSAAIAKRDDLDGEMVRFLARKGFVLVAETLVLNPRAAMDRETVAFLAPALADAPDMAMRLARRRGVEPAWLGPVFLALDAEARTGVVEAYRLDADARRTATRESLIAPPVLVLDALEFAALSRRPADLATGLGEVLEIGESLALRLVGDIEGDPLALALIAIGMPPDQAARVIMFASPAAGELVERMRALSLLMDRTPRLAAARLVRSMTTQAATPAPGRHEPVFAEGNPARPKSTGKRRDKAPAGRDTGRQSGNS